MRAANIKDASGNVMLDEASISQDEDDIFKEMMKTAVYTIAAKLFKVAQGVNNSIFHNSKLTLTNTIATVALGAGGSGYAIGDVLNIVQSGGSNGCAIVATIGALGAVATFETVAPGSGGSGYTAASTLPTTAHTGTGTGCTITITVTATLDILVDESSGFELVDNEAYNTNLLPVIDEEIKNCIRESCMKDWYGDILGLEGDFNIHSKKYQDSLREVSKLTFQLRKPTMS
jgi:hypothetical protein